MVSIKGVEDLKEIISFLLGEQLLRDESVRSFFQVGVRVELLKVLESGTDTILALIHVSLDNLFHPWVIQSFLGGQSLGWIQSKQF